MEEIINTLEKYADDADVRLIKYENEFIVFQIHFPSRGKEIWEMSANNVIHIDMSTYFILGKTKFGKLDLLTDEYIKTRNLREYSEDFDSYRVIEFTDIDEKKHILVLYGKEKYMKKV